jgi:pimeloyl-ACP methyl ester carboxylesterase
LTVAEDMHARIPGSMLVVIPGVGHMADMEAADRFNLEVRTFVKSVEI